MGPVRLIVLDQAEAEAVAAAWRDRLARELPSHYLWLAHITFLVQMVIPIKEPRPFDVEPSYFN